MADFLEGRTLKISTTPSLRKWWLAHVTGDPVQFMLSLNGDGMSHPVFCRTNMQRIRVTDRRHWDFTGTIARKPEHLYLPGHLYLEDDSLTQEVHGIFYPKGGRGSGGQVQAIPEPEPQSEEQRGVASKITIPFNGLRIALAHWNGALLPLRSPAIAHKRGQHYLLSLSQTPVNEDRTWFSFTGLVSDNPDALEAINLTKLLSNPEVRLVQGEWWTSKAYRDLWGKVPKASHGFYRFQTSEEPYTLFERDPHAII